MKTDTKGATEPIAKEGRPTPMVLDELTQDSAMKRPAKPPAGLGRVLDVSVALSARIGVVRKAISEIIDLQPGAVVDLDRSASEPIDVVIGDKLIAHGEIVVVDDRYGVRITEIVQDGR